MLTVVLSNTTYRPFVRSSRDGLIKADHETTPRLYGIGFSNSRLPMLIFCNTASKKSASGLQLGKRAIRFSSSPAQPGTLITSVV